LQEAVWEHNWKNSKLFYANSIGRTHHNEELVES
jgi:hypothetical protein